MNTRPNVLEPDVRSGLHRLNELDDYEVIDESLDIRGWDVLSKDQEHIGTVEDLILDARSLRVRYLLVRVEPVDGQGEAYLLLPIGLAEVDEKWDRIILHGTEARDVARLDRYRGGGIHRDYEQSLRQTLSREQATLAPDAFYNHPHFDDTRFLEWHKRSLRERAESIQSGLNENPYLRRR
jgi:sporulation protein YlmC with PRC-barrel domain